MGLFSCSPRQAVHPVFKRGATEARPRFSGGSLQQG
jgi:hypothetical protein